MRKAVRRYGEQRGRRMALRAQRDRQALNFATYLRYGEWRSVSHESMSERATEGANLINRVRVCPWNNAWLDASLPRFGRLYCQEIDLALVRGFNPELRLEVNQTLSNGGAFCEFVFHQAMATNPDAQAVIEPTRTVMPWGYHCAHLYQTCRSVLEDDYGTAGAQAAEAARQAFSKLYGAPALAEMDEYRSGNFNRIEA